MDEQRALLADKAGPGAAQDARPVTATHMRDRLGGLALLKERSGGEKAGRGLGGRPLRRGCRPARHQYPDARFLRRSRLRARPVRVRGGTGDPLRPGAGGGGRRHDRHRRPGRLAGRARRSTTSSSGPTRRSWWTACTPPARASGCISAATRGASWRTWAGWAATWWTSIPPCRSPRRARRWGRQQVLAGNLDPVRDLHNGTPESIHAALAECHRQAGARYIVAAGCEVPRDTPPANIRAMADYASSHQPE